MFQNLKYKLHQKQNLVLYVILFSVALAFLGYALISPPKADLFPTTTFVGFNSHQALILIENGTWTAIIPFPQNGTYIKFSSANYTAVTEWAMNQTTTKLK